MSESATTTAPPPAALRLDRESVRPHTPEVPVFAASSEARPRALRLLARVVALLVALWLLALVGGLLGLGSLPGLPFVGNGPSHQAPSAAVKHGPGPSAVGSAASFQGALATVRHAASDALGHRNSSRSQRNFAPATRGAPHAASPTKGGGVMNVAPQTAASPSSQSGTSAPPQSTGPSRSSSAHSTAPRSTSSPRSTHASTPPQSQAGTAPSRTGTTPSPSPQATEHAVRPQPR